MEESVGGGKSKLSDRSTKIKVRLVGPKKNNRANKSPVT